MINAVEQVREPRSILRAVFFRLLVYGGMGLAAAVWLVDFGPLLSREPKSRPVADEPASTDSGWPHHRGPQYNAHSAERDLANSWPAEGPPVLWMREIGHGYSGLIAVGNRLYTQTQSLTEQAVLALDADTGRTIWERRYGWPYDPGGMYPGPRATPTWSDGRLYIAAPDGLVQCLRAADGHTLWSININEEFKGRGTEFGYACSPFVEEGKVILPVGGPSAAVVALDAENGATVWASGDAPASYCSALPINFGGKRQVVAFLQNELAGFDLPSGRQIWHESYSHGYDEHSACPLYDEPYLRTMQPFRGGSSLYVIEAGEHDADATGESSVRIRPVRHDARMSNDVASSVLVNGYVYGFDLRDIQTNRHRPSRGQFRCMDFKTGEILWSSDRPGHATIVVADGKLLLLNDRGEVLLVRANPECYEELARAEVFHGEICWTAPSLYRSRLYLRSPTRAACLYVGKSERMDVCQQAAAIPTSAIPKTERWDLSWIVGGERECPFELPDWRELSQWYAFSLAVFALAGMGAGAAYSLLRLRGSLHAQLAAKLTFAVGLLVLGMALTPLGNRLSSQFVFTWPVTLFASHQIALASVLRGRQPDAGTKAAWAGAMGPALLLVACLAYYELARRLSLAPGWYFMVTFLAAWPLAIPAARRTLDRQSAVGNVLWTLAAFSLYFWVTGAIMLWRAATRT